MGYGLHLPEADSGRSRRLEHSQPTPERSNPNFTAQQSRILRKAAKAAFLLLRGGLFQKPQNFYFYYTQLAVVFMRRQTIPEFLALFSHVDGASITRTSG
jgi:hypothetical protein